jgi:DNA-binding winged helix-turn-helix (wHTH) protein/Tol biopolymer transport system component
MRDATGSRVRFGRFEFDLEREQLRRSGLPVRLPPQSARLLALLLRRAGDVVTREEIREHLWPDGTWVDFEQGINHCIRRIRTVLRDDASSARFVETLPRVGYRFTGGVETSDRDAGEADQGTVSTSGPSTTGDDRTATSSARRFGIGIGIGLTAVIALAVVLATVAGFGPPGGDASVPFDSIRLKQLTGNGSLWAAAISPDGKELAYAVTEAGGVALRLKSISSGREIRLIEPDVNPIKAVGFSPDGVYLYYLRQAAAGPGYSSIYRVSRKGGEPRELIFDVDSGVGFSPDQATMAFVRGDPSRRVGSVMAAGLDGSDERLVAEWSAPEILLPVAPAWSPDGQRIAVAVRGTTGSTSVQITVVNLADDSRRVLGVARWTAISGLAWLADGSGLLMTGLERGADDPSQIWRVDYPSGSVSRISHDLSKYVGLSKTADDRALVSVHADRQRSLWSTDIDGSARTVHWEVGDGRTMDLLRVRRGPDGGAIFTARKDGSVGLWEIAAPGAAPRLLVPESTPGLRRFAVSPDGEQLVIQAEEANGVPHLWRLATRGSQPLRLTNGDGEIAPTICVGQPSTVVHMRIAATGLWSVPLSGGEPRRISEYSPYSTGPVCDPDGTRLAFDLAPDEKDRMPRTLAVISIADGELIHRFPWPSQNPAVAWTLDGRALTYVESTTQGNRAWNLRLETGEPELLEVPAVAIGSFDWSVDGTRLLYARMSVRNDAVLITRAP